MELGVRFRDLVSDLLGRFSAAASQDVDKEVDRALQRLVELLGTDRSSLIEINRESGVMTITHSWARPGVVVDAPGTRISGTLPWAHTHLRKCKPVRFDRLPDELPVDAAAERELATSLPILSVMAVPLEVGRRWVCALGTSTARSYRSWADEDVEHIQIVGQLLANAIHRRNIETNLRESLAEVRRLQRRLEAENQYLRESVADTAGFEEIAGKSLRLREALELAARVAPTSTPVLLLGETGTGKELLARAIHARSKRSERPMIKVNCAALPSSLIESELFGHEKGAFTGAASAKEGRFELADGCTLFLDEVAELALEVQAKLLRVLESGEFERVGATRTRKVNVRIVAATNRDLERALDEGRFREDLYYRLSSFPIRLPPLRERRDDIPLLVWDLIQKRQNELGSQVERVPESAMEALTHYSWPGNIRELGNVIERALILSPGRELRLDAAFAGRLERAQLGERLEDVERAHLLQVLERCHWRISGAGHAAEALGMKPSTLRNRLKKLGIERPRIDATHQIR
jgi:transcriptional regulator with GAF, ATPase, and Fis domain